MAYKNQYLPDLKEYYDNLHGNVRRIRLHGFLIHFFRSGSLLSELVDIVLLASHEDKSEESQIFFRGILTDSGI